MTPPTVQFIPASTAKTGEGTSVTFGSTNIAAIDVSWTPSETVDPDLNLVYLRDAGFADDGVQFRFTSAAKRDAWAATYDGAYRVSVTYDGNTTTATSGWTYYKDTFAGIYRATIQEGNFASWSSLQIAGNAGVAGKYAEIKFI